MRPADRRHSHVPRRATPRGKGSFEVRRAVHAWGSAQRGQVKYDMCNPPPSSLELPFTSHFGRSRAPVALGGVSSRCVAHENQYIPAPEPAFGRPRYTHLRPSSPPLRFHETPIRACPWACARIASFIRFRSPGHRSRDDIRNFVWIGNTGPPLPRGAAVNGNPSRADGRVQPSRDGIAGA